MLRFKPITRRLDRRQHRDRVAEGLQPGDRIAINLPDEVADGSRVQPDRADGVGRAGGLEFRGRSCPAMKIARVTATPLNVPLHIKLVGVDRKTSLAACYVEVETDDGLIGHGLTSITEEDVVAQIVNGVAGPAIIGDDPLAHERVWDKLYWTLMPRGQTGYAAHALAAIDVALWDLKGKALGQPVWRLLGGAHPRGAGLCHVRLRLLRSRAACGGGEALALAGLPAAEDDGRQRGAAQSRRSSR